jgi:hypothetical protein
LFQTDNEAWISCVAYPRKNQRFKTLEVVLVRRGKGRFTETDKPPALRDALHFLSFVGEIIFIAL